jgi:MFS family permease
LQALAYAALGLCAFAAADWRLPLLVAIVIAGWGCGGLSVPAWTGLVESVVQRPRYGWFFGLRGAAQQVGVVSSIIGGGLLLSAFAARGEQALGFVALFLLAALARSGGGLLLAFVPERAAAPGTSERARARGGLHLSRKMMRLASYLWMLHFATHLATPFFVPYMLQELHFSYARVGWLLAVPAVVKIATLRLWGRVADRAGPGPLLRATGWIVAIIPALWLVSGSPWWILVAQILSGLVWGAFELAQASALLATTRARERSVAFFNLVDGGAILGGSLLGGAVVTVCAGMGLPGYKAAMASSALLRFVPAALLLWRVRGIGKPPWSHRRMPLRLWAVRPTRGMALRPWAVQDPGDQD